MEPQELVGYYTYRSFIDIPLPVDDFNKIRSEESELFLIVLANGTVSGTLSFPADPGAPQKEFMDITGVVKNWSSPLTIEFTGKGRPNTEIFDYVYEYSSSVAHSWEKGINQRLALIGTVLRAQDHHGSANQVAKAGETASFVSVKRDFTEPRDIEGVAILQSALSMLASRLHRLQHAVWHTVRGVWNDLDDASKTKIRDLDWGVDRPPFTKDRVLDLGNGAGEDFLFMHRKMISMVREEYDRKGIPYIESWKILPRSNAQQFAYSEQDDPANPGKKIYRFDAANSGFMVPPAQPSDPDVLKYLKSPEFFSSVMAQLERQYRSPSYLSALSLGALGNLLEFTIHNWMHMRWSSVSRDPDTGLPAVRDEFDFNEKWDNPKYDYLGEFYSSHVNPLFWRLHGWIDDRIEDWFKAHEASQPGEIERYDYHGIPWFKPGKWVKVSEPFYWPEKHDHDHDHAHHGSEQGAIKAMLKVMEIIQAAPENVRTMARVAIRPAGFGIMSFMRTIDEV
jgi:hypothetical protein